VITEEYITESMYELLKFNQKYIIRNKKRVKSRYLNLLILIPLKFINPIIINEIRALIRVSGIDINNP